MLAGILFPDKDSLHVNGRISGLPELGAGFDPKLSRHKNISLSDAILGMTNREIEGKFNEIIDFSGLGKFIDTPVKNYSSGLLFASDSLLQRMLILKFS